MVPARAQRYINVDRVPLPLACYERELAEAKGEVTA